MDIQKPFLKKHLNKILLIFLVLFIAFLFNAHRIKERIQRAVKTPQEKYEAMHPDKQLALSEDSITLNGGRISKPDFENKHSAESWFSDYSANKVAFDKDWDGQEIDVFGTISEINNRYGCAEIILSVGDNSFQKISCSNCPRDIDGWSKEVIKVAVGDQVHIKGRYDADGSSKYSLEMYKCHIVPYTKIVTTTAE